VLKGRGYPNRQEFHLAGVVYHPVTLLQQHCRWVGVEESQ